MASINNEQASNSRKKAAAFVNVTVLSSDGESKKNIGGIALYEDNQFHAALLAHLKSGGELDTETSIHIVEQEVNFKF